MIGSQLLAVAVTLVVTAGLSACTPEPSYIRVPAEPAVNTDTPPQTVPTRVNGAQAVELVERGAVIVDVRNLDEFNAGHIENAILLPANETATTILTVVPDKDQTILLYCRSGNRSGRVAAALAELGYTSIYDLGPMTDWPGEIVRP